MTAEYASPFLKIDGDITKKMLLIVDHASNHIPEEYADLGLETSELQRHIAFDIGVETVGTSLARNIQVPAVLGQFSRLIIDPNRGINDPTLIMEISDGTVIRGNVEIDETDIAKRIERFYNPYHHEISKTIDSFLNQGLEPTLISIHSFTPSWKGIERPWHFGVLWDERDKRMAHRLIDKLRAIDGMMIGDNEPYSGNQEGDTMNRHGLGRGLPHVLLEIRQDLIDSTTKAENMATLLTPIIGDMSLHK